MIEAMKLALEALEAFLRFAAIHHDGPDTSDKYLAEDYAVEGFRKARQVLPALRTAIEAAEQQEPAPGYCKHCKQYTIEEPMPDDLIATYEKGFNDCVAQRQPQYNKTEMNCFVQTLYDEKMREGKHGHYETMFHVVHRAIEAAHGIGEKNL